MNQRPDKLQLAHGCVIMASGSGTRFGGNKLMAELAGAPLIAHVLRATEGLFTVRVVVTRHADVAELARACGAQIVLHDKLLRNEAVALGMQALNAHGAAGACDTAHGCDAAGEPDAAGGRSAAGEHDFPGGQNTAGGNGNVSDCGSAGGCDTVTFFQADQPLIGRRTIAALLAAAERDRASIWRAAFEGTPGAPVLFPTWAFDELYHLPPRKGGGYVAKVHPERVRTVEAASPWELFDVDTTDDLCKLQDHLAQTL